MRLAYAIHGYGRGHAMRALGVLPHLMARHDVLILAGGDAYDILHTDYAVTRIPTLAYHYNAKGQISDWLTFKRNFPAVIDAAVGGPASVMVANVLKQFEPDVLITDSEIFSLRAAGRLGIPRITFDHFALLVYCKPNIPWYDRILFKRDSGVYRLLYGGAERIIASGFFSAPPRRLGVCVVGPVIREAVRNTRPTNGQHLLVYLNKGESDYTPRIERALLSLDIPVRVYGTPRRGLQQNIQFKPLSNLAFIEDLASCKAVFASAGNQLCGEVVHFGKPMLCMPQGCVEQRLNAAQIEKMGLGMQTRKGRVTPELMQTFLSRADDFRENAKRESRDGEREAFEAIERYALELSKQKDRRTAEKQNAVTKG